MGVPATMRSDQHTHRTQLGHYCNTVTTMNTINTSLLTIATILAIISLGDSDARIQYRHPRYQRQTSQHAQKVGRKVSVDPPQRRTFISALLMAEVQFLEGLLADQQREAQKAKPRPHKHSKTHPAHKVKYQRPHKQVRPASPPKKYVSKLDPFRMLDAPDLSKEAPVTEKTTTVKYGELEHYNLGSYLPPPPSDYKPSLPASPPAYQLPPVTTEAPSYAPPPPPPPPPVKYVDPAPAPAYHQPLPAYEAPVKAPAYEAPVKAPAYEAPVNAPAYETASTSNTNPHPHTFFHEAQAEKVHDGEWPTVYYNTFQGNQKTLIL